MTTDDTTDRLITQEEEQEALELAREFLERPDEYETMADRFRDRVVEFVLESTEVSDRLADRRHRIVGADFYPVDMDAEAALQPLRMGEVAIYDYEADVLLSAIVDLRASTVERVVEYERVQPLATEEDRDEAIELARAYLEELEATVSSLHVSLPEDHPRHGHRILEVVFGPGGDRGDDPFTSVFVDLSVREIVEDTEFPMLQ
jgi:hypothetical protein